MVVVRRGELTDAQWELIQPLLPPQRPRTGRPALDHRLIVNAILWLTRTGAPWRDLPERYGSWKTVYSRFRRWSEQGIWEQLFAALLEEAQRRGDLDWDLTTSTARSSGPTSTPLGPEKGGSRHGQPRAIRPQPRRLLHQAAHAGRR